MNLLETQRAVFASGLGPNEKLVALALLNHWCRARDTFPSVSRLVDWTSLHRTTVMKAIQALEGCEVLVVTRVNGRANRYELGGLTGLPQRPVCHSDRSATATAPVGESDTTGRPERPDQSLGATRSDPVSDPRSDPGKGDAASPVHPPSKVYRTDAAGTRPVDRLAATFAPKGEVELYAFAAWAEAFGKTGAVYDSKRAACLAERAGTGMTKQDADDAIAGALRDPWVIGKKDGKRHDRLIQVFGDAENYEEFRDLGRESRLRPLRSASTVDHEAAYQARIKAEAEARHAEAAAAVAAQGLDVSALPDLQALMEKIGNG